MSSDHPQRHLSDAGADDTLLRLQDGPDPTPTQPHDEMSVTTQSRRSDSTKAPESSETYVKSEEIAPTPQWRPRWLRKATLGVFAAVFLIIGILLIFMTVYSRYSHGLADSHDNMAYLWRFGPTALFTLLAVCWTRVELQALRYTPWFIIQREGGPEDVYDLDYAGMLFPVVLFQSFKRKHFLVFVVAATSLLLKVQIALSSSIFQSVLLPRPHPVNMQTLDAFNSDGNGKDALIDSMAFVAAIEQFNGSLPFGVSDECAYQTYAPLDSDAKPPGNGPVEPLKVTVDGLFAETECLLLESYDVTWNRDAADGDDYPSVELQFENCEETTFKTGVTVPYMDAGRRHNIGFVDDGLSTQNRTCSSLPQQSRPILWFVTEFSESPHNSSQLQIDNCEAVICSSSVWTSKVEVADDGARREVSKPLDPEAKSPIDWDLWKSVGNAGIMSRILESLVSFDEYYQSDVDLHFRAVDEPSEDVQFRSEDLQALVQELTRNYSSILAHDFLREDARQQVPGTRMKTVARMEANLGVCVAMVVLSAVCFASSLFAAFVTKGNFGFYRDPATVLGSIIYLCSRSEHDQTPGESGSSRKSAWSQGTRSLLPLHNSLRVTVVIYVLGLVIALSLTLWRSREFDGLLTISGGEYWPLLWQSLPTIAMLFVSVYSSSSSAAFRSLVEFSEMLHKPQHAQDMDQSLIDMLGVNAMYHAIRRRMPALTLLQFLSALAGFLPALSSILLITEQTSIIAHLDVKEETWFGSQLTAENNFTELYDNRVSLGNLVLWHEVANFTSPSYTYEDLLFPQFQINDSLWGPDATAKVKISAAKLSPTCEKLSDDDFDILYEMADGEQKTSEISKDEFDAAFGDEDMEMEYSFQLRIVRHYDCPDDTRQNLSLASWSHQGPLITSSEGWNFGASVLSPSNPIRRDFECNGRRPIDKFNPAWVERTYTWGKLSPGSSSDFDHLSVWNCNYTWVDVETDLRVLWSEEGVTIDHNSPPTWDESTARPWDPPFSVPMIDELIVSDTSNYTNLDDLGIAGLPSIFVEPTGASRLGDIGVETNFGYILEPYGPITKGDLGSRDMEEDILRSLHSGVTFAVAQLANREQRLGKDESSLSSPSTIPRDSSRNPISVEITDHTKQRVVQNATVTFILIAILSVVAIVHIWAVISESWRRYAKPLRRNLWLLDLELRGVAPPDLNSFNMMKALLEDSNCGKILPANAHLMSAEELHRHLQRHEFRLGWFYNSKTEKDVYTIGALNEGDLVVQRNSP